MTQTNGETKHTRRIEKYGRTEHLMFNEMILNLGTIK